ncbi:hypothetical protein ATANTOWER_008230 [Ataeniobius toweri]|uniref:Uncharacterized protein n=1 Tax=Ataeniobius toweri TaxID=208326 RepID=A0ABU7BTP2_9TELE|nr:hypothetical protein [Ataeniobius toweri]
MFYEGVRLNKCGFNAIFHKGSCCKIKLNFIFAITGIILLRLMVILHKLRFLRHSSFCSKNNPIDVPISYIKLLCPFSCAKSTAGNKLAHMSHTHSLSCHIHIHTQQLSACYYYSATSLISWLNRNVKSKQTGWCDDMLGTEIMGAGHTLITTHLFILFTAQRIAMT